MTVEELIKELEKMPKEKIIEIGSDTTTYGPAVRVKEYRDSVEIEKNEDYL